MKEISNKANLYRSSVKDLKETGIVDIIGDAISIQDTNFKVIYQNQRHRNLVGDRRGEYCFKAYQDKDCVCKGCHLALSFKDGKIRTIERTRNTEKGIQYAEITSSVLKNAAGTIIAGIEVVRDITQRKQAEIELNNANFQLDKLVKERTKELQDSNAALRSLLRQRDQEQKELQHNILSNMKYLISPYIDKLKKNKAMSEELDYLNAIESNLKVIISPFSSNLSTFVLDLTPREILVANLIKDGKKDKDIMEILNISLETVKSHRQNIRKKLGIYGKRINLRTKLLSLV